MLLLTIFIEENIWILFNLLLNFHFTWQFLCVFWFELYKKNNKLGSILSLHFFFQLANLHVLLKNGVKKYLLSLP